MRAQKPCLEFWNKLSLGSDNLVIVRVSSWSFLKETEVGFWWEMGREQRSHNVC